MTWDLKSNAIWKAERLKELNNSFFNITIFFQTIVGLDIH